ncbi:MAG: sulfotransferase domain-containing protein [Caulobacterales bacterium]
MPTMLRAPTREYRTAIMDSHRWDAFKPRADDIIIATYPKCGTTWTQRIVDLLVFQSPEPREFLAISPWLDATFFAPIEQDLATLEAQTHRRFIKTHMPLDSVPLFEGVKMIHVVRDGRDACISMHNHMLGFNPQMVQLMAAMAAQDPRIQSRGQDTPADPREYFLLWMDLAEAEVTEAYGVDLPFCEFEETYWRARREPWLLTVNYADMKADLAGQMRRISDFLGIATPESLLAELARAATFETMKRQGEALMPGMRNAFDHGSQRFLNQGFNGRWKNFLTDADLARYDALIRRKLSPTHARWIELGTLAAGDPRTLAD